MTINTSQSVAQQQIQSLDELIMVVKRADLFAVHPAWSGIKSVDMDQFLSTIGEKKEFLPRSIMETEPRYKQIIPYLVFEYNNRYFLMQRTAQATEKRLQNKYSLGIGGHIRQEDMTSDSIIDWARREFHEEINYTGSFTIEPIGILNDDSNPVGQVHIGFVFVLHGCSDEISIKSELKSGALVSLDECKEYFNALEPWSQMVFEFLINK